jgi:uncharacterized protein DUF3551
MSWGIPVLLQVQTGSLTMIRTTLTASAILIFMGVGFQPAAADYYAAPWCAVVAMGDGDMQWDCEFRTIEECRPHVLAGNRGWCNPNPYLSAATATPHVKRHRKKHVRAQ